MTATIQQMWEWLGQVPDPEIPVISLVDLGVIRSVDQVGGEWVVTISPTYTGCPATRVIEMDIQTALSARGVAVKIRRQIAPPWTTDWMTDSGKAKLEAYGIAPPQPSGGPQRCPHCASTDVEKISQFGSTPCKAQWRCRDCLEPFDYFKCI